MLYLLLETDSFLYFFLLVIIIYFYYLNQYTQGWS